MLKEVLNHGVVLEKVHRVIKFNQEEKNILNDFEKDILKSKNNAVFGKTMKNVRRYREISSL